MVTPRKTRALILNLLLMKSIIRQSVAALTVAALITATAAAATPSKGYADFGDLSPAAGEQFVQVDLNGTLLKLAAAFTKNEDANISALISKLESVRVNVLGLSDANRVETTAQIEAIRTSLDAQGWTRVVTVREGKGDDVAVFIKEANDSSIHGLVVSVISDSGEAVLVNIVGDVGVDQLAKLGERLNIDPLRKLELKAAAKS